MRGEVVNPVTNQALFVNSIPANAAYIVYMYSSGLATQGGVKNDITLLKRSDLFTIVLNVIGVASSSLASIVGITSNRFESATVSSTIPTQLPPRCFSSDNNGCFGLFLRGLGGI